MTIHAGQNQDGSQVAALIRQEIRELGAIPFDRYMELALYHPTLGYYERHPDRIGRAGDFYTSVSVGPLFGELLGFAFAEWMADRPGAEFEIIECGAHDGRLAADVLGWLRDWLGADFERVRYAIVEGSARRRQWQAQTLGILAERVRWVGSWSEVPPGSVAGVVLANEFLDALPVRRFGWDRTAQTWYEWGVGVREDRFAWVRLAGDPAGAAAGGAVGEAHLDQWLGLTAELRAVLPDGFVVEFCPAATAWWRVAARGLASGRIVVFDYGLARDELFSAGRAQGTVRGYRRHALVDRVLDDPGEQDLTAHVNFAAVQRAGELEGLVTEHFGRQGEFLTKIAARTWRKPQGFPAWTAERRRQLLTLVHPDHLGRAFRVLVQARSRSPAEDGAIASGGEDPRGRTG